MYDKGVWFGKERIFAFQPPVPETYLTNLMFSLSEWENYSQFVKCISINILYLAKYMPVHTLRKHLIKQQFKYEW